MSQREPLVDQAGSGVSKQERVTFRAEEGRAERVYGVYLGSRRIGQVFSSTPGLWAASNGKDVFSASTLAGAARFLVRKSRS